MSHGRGNNIENKHKRNPSTHEPKRKNFLHFGLYQVSYHIGTIVAIILLISLISSFDEKKEVYLNLTIVGNGIDLEGVDQLQENLTIKLVKDNAAERSPCPTINL